MSKLGGWGLVLVSAMAVVGGVWRFGVREPVSPRLRVAELRQTAVPDFEFRWKQIPQAGVAAELLDPAEALPQSFRYSRREIVSLFRYASTCAPEQHPRSISRALGKALQWHELVCGEREALPEKFFESPPYLHPSGASFAELARESGRANFRDKAWLAAHFRFFHLRELGDWSRELESGRTIEALTAASEDALRALVGGEPVVLARPYLFLRLVPPREPDISPGYAVYRASLLGPESEVSEARPGMACVWREGNLCWKETSPPTKLLQLALALVTALLGASLVALGVQALQQRRQRRREAEARTFLLQTLTHELRTPAATLALCVESLRRDFDSLGEKAQTTVLHLCNEVQRLRRVVEASSQYLHGGGNEGLLRFRFVEAESINDLLRAVLEPYEGKISFTELASDRAFRVDRYWLSLCVRNLVDNALSHGAAPVSVALRCEQERLCIQVRDAGYLASFDFEAPAPRPVGYGTSKGLGLGLAIVSRVVRLMNGTLTFEPEPTTFSLWIGGAK